MNWNQIEVLQKAINRLQQRLDVLLADPQKKFCEIHKTFRSAFHEAAKKHRIFKTCYSQPYDLGPDGEFTGFHTEKNWLGEHSFVIGAWEFEFNDGERYYNEAKFPQEYFVLPIEEVQAIAEKEAEQWVDKELRADGRRVDPII